MVLDLRPFRGIRPKVDLAEKVASPPYDVVNSEEARELARGNPLSFLHVVKPEIDLDPGINLYDDSVYAKGVANLQSLVKDHMVRDDKPCFYVYQQKMGDHVQAGVVGNVSAWDYHADLVRKHELTRADKEADRTRHVRDLNANTGPVFLTYRSREGINTLVDEARKETPVYDFISPDGIAHTFWVVSDAEKIAALKTAFCDLDCLYVADGHHRSASGSNIAIERKEKNPGHTGDEEYNFFMAVMFPHDQLAIMDYNRVVKDLNGLSKDEFLERANLAFDLERTDVAKPDAPHRIGMYLNGQWYALTAKEGTYDAADPVKSLDVAILQGNLLEKVLGIGDPRKDSRIDFVGGIRGMKELEKRVSQGWAVAFAMYPTSVEQLMAIADAGAIMPPKSTWFEPKLLSGLLVHVF